MPVERNEFEDLIGEFPREEEPKDDEITEPEEEPKEVPEETPEDPVDPDNDDDDIPVDPKGDGEDGENREEEDGDKDPEEEEEGEKELTELERLREQNRLLMEQLNGVAKETVEDSKVEDPKEEEDPLKGVDTEELLDDPEKFKEFLNNYAKKVREETLKKSEDVVSAQIQQQFEINRLVTNFYADNPQLAGVKKYIGMVAKEIASENPNKPYEDVLKETAERAYKNLGIQKSVIKPNRKKPSFAKAGTKAPRTPKTKKSKVEEQIDAIIDLDY